MRKKIILFAFLCGISGWPGCKEPNGPAVSSGKNGEQIYRNGAKESKSLQLADGSRLRMSAGTVVIVPAGFARPGREITLHGETLFRIGAGHGQPFVVHTRNLLMAVTDTAGAVFRVNAFPDSSGEQVDLLSGHLKLSKSYSSTTDNDPVTLGAGEMLMINRDIDLMEKEAFDTTELKRWIAGQQE
jgi:ferric-dicitrate binding protein FerR (iron transport regulator)